MEVLLLKGKTGLKFALNGVAGNAFPALIREGSAVMFKVFA